jgi:hypothetical protein
VAVKAGATSEVGPTNGSTDQSAKNATSLLNKKFDDDGAH